MTDDTSNPFKKLATLFQSAEKTVDTVSASKKGAQAGRLGSGLNEKSGAQAHARQRGQQGQHGQHGQHGKRGTAAQGAAGGAGVTDMEDAADTALFFNAVSNIKPLSGGRGGGKKRLEPEEALAHRMAAAKAAKAGAAAEAAAEAVAFAASVTGSSRAQARLNEAGPVSAKKSPVLAMKSADSAEREFLDALGSTVVAQRGKAGGRAGLVSPGNNTVSPDGAGLPVNDTSSGNEPAEDADLFSSAMQGVTPVNGKGREVAAPLGGAKAAVPAHDPAKALRDLLQGKVEFSLQHSGEYLEGHVVGMDPAIMARLRAGQFSPEKHLDLHGMNAMQAYDALTWFIKDAYQKSLRTVVVVTGRGKNSPDGVGVLRPLLQEWLCKDPFKRVVLAFCTARPHDGGPGAIYVALRKYKKSRGKITWELPNHQ